MSGVAGCELGKASASFVLALVDDGGNVVVEEVEYAPHDEKPLAREVQVGPRRVRFMSKRALRPLKCAFRDAQ